MKKFLSYCFLYDDTNDLRCDFEILSDEISSLIGLLRSIVLDKNLQDDLSKVNELMYHINPTLRTKLLVTESEFDWLYQKTQKLQEETENILPDFNSETSSLPKFVLPQGCTAACISHVIRSKCKVLVRLLSRHKQQGHDIDVLLFNFTNLYSGYFYFLALKLNCLEGIKETEFKSRAYK
ncbi:MAG: ATP--cob(I)alamin adenosyltransferase [Elusimicrobiota bacterium]|jgi:cob(I)alamin adenosyltransferase|nr:ATP--cob(I)alamin adenosyltransferase [Elusimicrobiota bacterium]